MVPTPHKVFDLAQEISRAGRDGKDSVAMVLYNSYNLRTGEPEVKAFVTSTDCRRLAMLNVFIKQYYNNCGNNNPHFTVCLSIRALHLAVFSE
jgi:superfamily II DNA helicase RecQ